mmetsp:Transcript_10879/g.21322  ORF Transcript_10879/g.21322 Transcript_10879/m.21322 type:complete len:407 (-) Transcript_10879:928-2148(-)
MELRVGSRNQPSSSRGEEEQKDDEDDLPAVFRSALERDENPATAQAPETVAARAAAARTSPSLTSLHAPASFRRFQIQSQDVIKLEKTQSRQDFDDGLIDLPQDTVAKLAATPRSAKRSSLAELAGLQVGPCRRSRPGLRRTCVAEKGGLGQFCALLDAAQRRQKLAARCLKQDQDMEPNEAVNFDACSEQSWGSEPEQREFVSCTVNVDDDNEEEGTEHGETCQGRGGEDEDEEDPEDYGGVEDCPLVQLRRDSSSASEGEEQPTASMRPVRKRSGLFRVLSSSGEAMLTETEQTHNSGQITLNRASSNSMQSSGNSQYVLSNNVHHPRSYSRSVLVDMHCNVSGEFRNCRHCHTIFPFVQPPGVDPVGREALRLSFCSGECHLTFVTLYHVQRQRRRHHGRRHC